MSSTQAIYLLISFLCFVPAIVLHEMAHGFAAYKLGDPTAKNAGRLSLNPIKHIDWFGTILLPLMLALANGPIFGYAKPVPYNPRYFKNLRTGEAIVGVAGPCANLLLALAAAAVSWVLYPTALGGAVDNDAFAMFYLYFLPMFALVNLYLMFFNLIPIPPLDGASLIALLLPNKAMGVYYKVQQYAMPIFLVLVIVVPYVFGVDPIGAYLNFTANNMANLLFPYDIL
jgi:Zn-dependent protease